MAETSLQIYTSKDFFKNSKIAELVPKNAANKFQIITDWYGFVTLEVHDCKTGKPLATNLQFHNMNIRFTQTGLEIFSYNPHVSHQIIESRWGRGLTSCNQTTVKNKLVINSTDVYENFIVNMDFRTICLVLKANPLHGRRSITLDIQPPGVTFNNFVHSFQFWLNATNGNIGNHILEFTFDVIAASQAKKNEIKLVDNIFGKVDIGIFDKFDKALDHVMGQECSFEVTKDLCLIIHFFKPGYRVFDQRIYPYDTLCGNVEVYGRTECIYFRVIDFKGVATKNSTLKLQVQYGLPRCRNFSQSVEDFVEAMNTLFTSNPDHKHENNPFYILPNEEYVVKKKELAARL